MAMTPCIEGGGLLCAAAPTSGHKPECEEQWEADGGLTAALARLGAAGSASVPRTQWEVC